MRGPEPPAARARDPGDDHDVMMRVVGREPEALTILMARYWRPLMAYLIRTFGWGADEAEDVVQEVFVRVWQLPGWDATAGTVKAFLVRVARNLALARVRHLAVRDRAGSALREAGPGPVPTPLEDLESMERRAALAGALALLPDRRREALILVRYQGLSLEEAATLMELSRKTVANHVSMALEDLRRLLGPHLD